MSVPPTGPPHATLKPGQTRHLPTRLVTLSQPQANNPLAMPAKGEKLQIGDIGQLTDDAQVQKALKRLADDKAPDRLAAGHVACGRRARLGDDRHHVEGLGQRRTS